MNLTLMRKSSFALVATTLGMIGYLWGAWCEFPFHPWNDVRLAPAFAVRHGINPYPLLEGGPLFTWIYGPVGILVNLPATWATTALGAIQTASVLNALTVLAPLAMTQLVGVSVSVPKTWKTPSVAPNARIWSTGPPPPMTLVPPV